MYTEDIKLFPHISSLLIYDHLIETHVSFVEEIVVYSHCKLQKRLPKATILQLDLQHACILCL